ncbi:hypothetical protein M409DRAFT_26649 [Zasmidium cellare ATCC 36951]|uniref:BTB domain-containing protein n=1 Tax=Zasmidium cellare ATCC 36951 TaxID=1080233 RepID=A0A6A6C6P9_ZASCE|nr:uncharacterized protein M409DRAFT_26649 [Zasmidium cellare ATCC 36951]KAF2162794.1 hypothetical protein M409DRAFT_26649 [Zasmidium cellare ATCC 36951]
MANGTSLMSSFAEEINSECVIITAGDGDSARRFSVPQSLLCRKSKWFENAFKAGKTKEIALPQDDPAAVESSIFFVYNDSLIFKTGRLSIEQRSFDLKLCYNIWSFANRCLLSELQNAATHRACYVLNDSNHDNDIPTITLRECFEVTTAESPLRALIGDYCVKLFEKHDENDFHIEELEGCPGLVATLHQSEVVRRKLDARDFPRYVKPAKLAETLLMKEEEPRRDAVEWRAWGGWDEIKPTCKDCAYSSSTVRPVCSRCQRERCKCYNQTWVLLCSGCWPKL